MNHFAVRENHRTDNLGDRLITSNMVSTLARYGQVRAWNPALFLDRLEEYRPFVHSSRNKRILAALSGKGHYLIDAPGGFGEVQPAATAAGKRGRQLTDSIKRLILPRKIALGFSITIKPDDPRYDDYDCIGVRDHKSLASLKSRHLGKALYFPDWAFFSPLTAASGERTKGLALSFRQYNPDHKSDLSADELTPVIETLAQHFGRPAFFHQVDEDEAFVASLSAGLSLPHDRSSRPLGPDSYEEFYRNTRVVASNRLHCLLFAAVNGALPIALVSEGHAKITSLFETLKWTDLIVPVGPDSASSIAKIVARREELAGMVARTCNEQRSLGESILTSKFGTPIRP
ncbi:polysaccharide pyruvyl transferase family protein [Luteolibacter luteus]|uniref:Polysaccharide pyruvyl transferase family protein n=1 Tax=Luteolibacter luteus TaxID=2728835 RepID=A0A858RBX8_9BACT|nr:polysaccharide pyruvyl transferase family protein [Luteolibacter luteus]QJE94277.1 polysaccharide pyruvyl transferase family protein [Luteolibacter luteus]